MVAWGAKVNRLQYFPGLGIQNRKSQVVSDVTCHVIFHSVFLEIDVLIKPKPHIQIARCMTHISL